MFLGKKKSDKASTCTLSEGYSDEDLLNIKLSSSMDKNIDIFKKIIGDSDDFVIRKFLLGTSNTISSAIIYFDSITNNSDIDSNILKPLLNYVYTSNLDSGTKIAKAINLGCLISRAEMKFSDNIKDLIESLSNGSALLLLDGVNKIYVLNVNGHNYRPLSEAEVETVVRGPRDAFNEVLNVNIALIRRRIHSANLTFNSMKIGKITGTKVCVGYIKGLCSSDLVEKVISKLKKLDTNSVLSDSYIEEFINDNHHTLFPQMRNTERPDVASAALLEGRLIIIIDNTPVVLIVPGEFFSMLQSAEDYYNRYVFSSLVRILRYIALIIALVLPAFYIAIVNFHQELIPTKLLVSIIAARTGVPLPNFAEAILMEITFEILREAGVRLPRPVGQAVSIVGALVIGQAAVQASIVSPLMVIVVSLTGIATFSIPQYNISLPIRVLRFVFMLLAAFTGFYGLMLGLLSLLVHLCSIKSFGIPYLSPLAPFKINDLKDVFMRMPYDPSKNTDSKAIHNKKPIE
ncbi:spore germination protein [Clostridium felsineum]|uniref:spore germination protein n=1 Tax=Clostridium felsineum TaxID=36839 RepID=UPI00098CB46A|nr:spore germination protein [Clostridium felsineum]URZ18480.1 Spore germination protein A1 [Clostridium felsineum DSM 794]